MEQDQTDKLVALVNQIVADAVTKALANVTPAPGPVSPDPLQTQLDAANAALSVSNAKVQAMKDALVKIGADEKALSDDVNAILNS